MEGSTSRPGLRLNLVSTGTEDVDPSSHEQIDQDCRPGILQAMEMLGGISRLPCFNISCGLVEFAVSMQSLEPESAKGGA